MMFNNQYAIKDLKKNIEFDFDLIVLLLGTYDLSLKIDASKVSNVLQTSIYEK